MQPNELTVEQVRNEFETLIEQFPDRRGSVNIPSEFDDQPSEDNNTCVYYLDEDGDPINGINYSVNERPVFKQPVCIIGQWIEDFHPEFKNNELIHSMLIGNATVGSLANGANPFDEDVKYLLSTVQNAQDASNAQWKDIPEELNRILGN